MNIKDIIALAKQGYTVSDVKELLSLGEQIADPVPQVEEAEQKTVQEDVQKVEAEPVKADAIDYRTLYEEEKVKNDQLTESLSKAQLKNVTVDMSDKSDTSDNDLITDLVRSFM